MSSTQTALAWCSAFVAVALLTRAIGRKCPAPYPPGPKGLPLIGNVFDMPSTYIWRTFTEWGRTYGDMIYVNILGQPIVIVNSAEQAASMLEKKSSIYSNRPTLQMGGELVGWNKMTVLMPYGHQLREHRRYINHSIGSKTLVKKHYGVLIDESKKLLKRILGHNEDIGAEIHKTAGAIILNLAYGYTAQEGGDPLVALAEEARKAAEVVTTPGLWLVDTLPALRHLPAWFPGAEFKRAAAEMRKVMIDFVNVPYEFTKQALAKNVDLPPNFLADHLAPQNHDPTLENNIKWTAASMYIAGSDTVTSAMHTFVLAMMLHPEVQKRAQAEIDLVVGDGRLPSFEHRGQLPFVDAIVKEILRWRCPGPINIPHSSMEDDVHNGYFIPKGTTIVVNLWAILHDQEIYPNPDVFDPTRYVTEKGEATAVPHPYDACFGYGRRSCPGANFADAELFIWCAMILAVYDISKAMGPDGKAIEPSGEYTSDAVSHPKPFKYSIAPRSESAEKLIFSMD